MLIDTHVHVIGADHHRFPLTPAGLPGAWYREAPVDADQLLAMMDAAGVDRAVLVQPMSAYSYDNRYAADSAARFPARLASVCIVDPHADDACQSLAYWTKERAMNGMRLFAVPDGAWLDDPRTFPLWRQAAALAVPIVVTILRHEIPRLRTMLTRFPEVPVALDHCGFPDLTGGPPYPAAGELFALADFPNVSLKLSTTVLDAAVMHGGDPGDIVAHLVERFGAQRVMWGSDYSQTHDRSYQALVDLARSAVSRLSEADQRWCLGESALRLWPELRG